jgi:sugar transferase (PEP-CTERM/EpsH1 system associated)
MKILWVKAGKLLPVDTGGKIRSYNILRRLNAGNDVTLLSYYGGARDIEYEKQIADVLPGTLSVHTGVPESSTLDYLRRLPHSAPYAVTKFTSREVQSKVATLLAGGRFDIAVCDFLAASLNFPSVLKTPTVLFQHNVESALWERQARHEANPLNRIVYKLEAAKMLRYERAAVARFHHVIAVSEHDRELMSAMTRPARISVVPTGVDLKQFSGDRTAARDAAEPLVIFVGSMDWEANIDAVDYFCREVWPAVKQAVPEARFRIVGRNPNSRVRKLASDSIEVTGTVASVIEHYREASVNIVPLRIGGGTRLKIYEAMAMGKATVSTPIGAEGLDVNDGNDIMLADSPEKFAESLIALLTDNQLRERIERDAAKQAARYDWSVITERFEEVLAEIANTLVGAAPCGRPPISNDELAHQGRAATRGRPCVRDDSLASQGGAATEGRPYNL